jgi:hypothetical protein
MMIAIDNLETHTRTETEILESKPIVPRTIFTEQIESEEADWPPISPYLRQGNRSSGWQCPTQGAQTN